MPTNSCWAIPSLIDQQQSVKHFKLALAQRSAAPDWREYVIGRIFQEPIFPEACYHRLKLKHPAAFNGRV
jgi:hypothetical protein